ncbi:hypothetical protein [Lacrimispora sp.]
MIHKVPLSARISGLIAFANIITQYTTEKNGLEYRRTREILR